MDDWRSRLFPVEDVTRAARHFWVGLFLLVLLLAVAVQFYVNIEATLSRTRWSYIDGLYMAVLTITTIGFREVHPLSEGGRLFTIGYAVTGILLLAWAARSAAGVLVGQQLSVEVQRRRRLRAVREMRDHYVVCGYGRMGREAVQQLRRRGLSVVVIEQEGQALEAARACGVPFVEGNATEDEHLKSAGVERARGLIAAVGTDEDNLFIVLSARLLNPNLYIVARAGLEASVDKLRRAGANHVLSPYVVGGRVIAAAVAEPGVVDFIEAVLHHEVTDLEIASIALPAQSPACGRSISTSGLLREGGAMILAIMDDSGRFHTNPGPEAVVKPGDRLIAMGLRAQLAELQRAVGGSGVAC